MKPLIIKVNGKTYSTFRGNDRVSRLFYWHAKTKNGRIVADGSQGYSTHGNAKRAMRKAAAR